MTISSRIRKMLWARSANRCAICKIVLISDNKKLQCQNIGEECHIISKKSNGPRHKMNIKNYDVYENLILLCRNHHRIIDEKNNEYSIEKLKEIKKNHEEWVNTSLNENSKNSSNSNSLFLKKVTSGNELLSIISNVDGYRYNFDEVSNNNEGLFLDSIIQKIINFGEAINNDIDSNSARIAYELTETLKELNEKGYFIFGEKNANYCDNNLKVKDFIVAELIISKKDNPNIIIV